MAGPVPVRAGWAGGESGHGFTFSRPRGQLREEPGKRSGGPGWGVRPRPLGLRGTVTARAERRDLGAGRSYRGYVGFTKSDSAGVR